MIQLSNKIIQIGHPDRPRCFTLSEARETLQTVKPITAKACDELEDVKSKLHQLLPSDPRLQSIEQEYETIVRSWISKMSRLGVLVRGLWLLDFDSGDGYFCWKYPELTISHYHPYGCGFIERKPIAQVIAQQHPDWADVDVEPAGTNVAIDSLLPHQIP